MPTLETDTTGDAKPGLLQGLSKHMSIAVLSVMDSTSKQTAF